MLLALLTALQVASDGIVVEGADKRDAWLSQEVSLLGAARALNYAEDQGDWSLEVALAEEAPGAIVFNSADGGIENPQSLVGVGGAAQVVSTIDIDVAPLQQRPSRVGVFRDGSRWQAWELYVADGVVEGLTVGRIDGAVVLVDVRLLGRVPAQVLEALRDVSSSARSSFQSAGATAGAIEGLILFVWMTTGGLLLQRGSFARWSRPSVALLVGIAIQASFGALVGSWYVMAIPVIVTVLSALWARSRGEKVGWGRHDLPVLSVAAGALIALGVATRVLGLVFVSDDTLDYLNRAALQADGSELFAVLSGQAPGLSALHAVGAVLGIDAVFSLGGAVFLASVALFAITVWSSRRDRLTWPMFAVVVLALITSEQVRTFGLLLNSHMIVSGLAVVLAIIWDRQSGADARAASQSGSAVAAALPTGVVAAAVVLLRPEGLSILVLLLLGTLGVSSFTAGIRGAWYGGGVAAILDNVAAIHDMPRGGSDWMDAGVVLFGAGMVLLIAPGLLQRVPRRFLRLVPPAALAALWAVLVGMVAAGDEVLNRLVANTGANLFQGLGGWGIASTTLLLLLVVALAGVLQGGLRPHARLSAPLLTLTIGFFPTSAFVRAFGSGVSGRVHWHDSINRMWLHILLALAMLAILYGLRPSTVHQEFGDRRWRLPLTAPVIAGALALGALPAVLWQPTFASEAGPSTVVVIDATERAATADLDEAIPLHPGRSSIVGLRPFSEAAVPESDPQRIDLCFLVPLATGAGTASGDVALEISDRPGLSSIREVDRLNDVLPSRFCIPVPGPEATVAELLASFEGQLFLALTYEPSDGGPLPRLLVDADGIPAIGLEVTWTDRTPAIEPLIREGPRLVSVASVMLLAFLVLRGPVRYEAKRRQSAGFPAVPG